MAKPILAPLGIKSEKDAGIPNPKKIHSSRTTALIISNEEINDIIKILQAPDNSDILLQEITKAIENETL